MSTVLARFKRNGERVKIVADLEAGSHFIITSPADLTVPAHVERFSSRYLLLHVDLYQAAGYTRLTLCASCQGSGRGWVAGTHDDASLDVCPRCQGEGGSNRATP